MGDLMTRLIWLSATNAMIPAKIVMDQLTDLAQNVTLNINLLKQSRNAQLWRVVLQDTMRILINNVSPAMYIVSHA